MFCLWWRTHNGFYRPLVSLSFWADERLFGLEPFGYGLTNLAFFLAAGPAIRRGHTLPAITSRDVAPTIAHALGVGMDGIEGRRLDEILA